MSPYVIKIIIWSVVVVAAIVVEVCTVNLTTIWFAIAGVVSLILALLDVNIIWQCVVFLVLSIILLLLTRPLIRRITRKSNAHTNADRIFDKTAVVTKEISPDEIGEVQIDEDIWRAISESKETFSVGEKVIINSFEGNKVIVSKIKNK